MPQKSPDQVLRFGVFEVNFSAQQVRKHGIRLRLAGQPLAILAMLLERPGEVVTREELQGRLWASDTFVDFEHSLNSAIKKLRAALNAAECRRDYIQPCCVSTKPCPPSFGVALKVCRERMPAGLHEPGLPGESRGPGMSCDL